MSFNHAPQPRHARDEAISVAPPAGDAGTPLLHVEDLTVTLRTGRGDLRAVDGVSFELRAGETLGLVGESGSGKSTVCLALLKLLPRNTIGVTGRVLFHGTDLVPLGEQEMREYRGRRIGIVLQDPMTSLNPLLRVGDQVAEPAYYHLGLRGRALWERVVEALRRMRIPDPVTRVRSYPHQLSGGMRQRVSGAIALSAEPALLIADEPTTALDATIQAQYLALLKEVQRQS